MDRDAESCERRGRRHAPGVTARVRSSAVGVSTGRGSLSFDAIGLNRA